MWDALIRVLDFTQRRRTKNLL